MGNTDLTHLTIESTVVVVVVNNIENFKNLFPFPVKFLLVLEMLHP